MLVDCDLHLHGKFSAATSKDMNLKTLASNARVKGIEIVATADCLHPDWMTSIKELTQIDAGTFEWDGTRFILSVEVEDKDRVHHLILFPSLEAVKDFRASVENFSSNINTDGRPNINLSGEAIARIASNVDALIGPAHIFTPWTALYKSFPSVSACYGSMTDYITFIELGLSADTYMADQISELSRFTFLSNSDAHSPFSHRLGREFNRMELEDKTFSEVAKAIKREDGRKIALNVGLDPREGKYYATACSHCYQKYSPEERRHFKGKCVKCGGIIKIGVKDRVAKLANQFSTSPEHRPDYVYIYPLSIIIQSVLGLSSPTAKSVQEIYNELVPTYGTETELLLDVPTDTLPKMGDQIQKVRDGEIVVIPGGGGRYGKLIIPKDHTELKNLVKKHAHEINCVSGLSQKTLGDFSH